VGDRPIIRSLLTQNSTTQKNADIHPCLERDSNSRWEGITNGGQLAVVAYFKALSQHSPGQAPSPAVKQPEREADDTAPNAEIFECVESVATVLTSPPGMVFRRRGSFPLPLSYKLWWPFYLDGIIQKKVGSPIACSIVTSWRLEFDSRRGQVTFSSLLLCLDWPWGTPSLLSEALSPGL
jgi:hypothetical protein